MPIYINILSEPATAEDIKALFDNIRQKKDSIKRVVFLKNCTRIYTV